MASQPKHSYTFEDYLELEERSAYKSEFHAGEIFSMSGGTELHSRLSSRMNAVLERHLPACRIYDSNLKLYLEGANQGVYPDCMALCEDPWFWKERQDVVLNPVAVVEVLSSSTQDYDRGAKALHCRSVPSIQHILLISQDRVFVEHLWRQDQHTWTLTEYDERRFSLTILKSEITLEEIYRNIL